MHSAIGAWLIIESMVIITYSSILEQGSDEVPITLRCFLQIDSSDIRDLATARHCITLGCSDRCKSFPTFRTALSPRRGNILLGIFIRDIAGRSRYSRHPVAAHDVVSCSGAGEPTPVHVSSATPRNYKLQGT